MSNFKEGDRVLLEGGEEGTVLYYLDSSTVKIRLTYHGGIRYMDVEDLRLFSNTVLDKELEEAVL